MMVNKLSFKLFLVMLAMLIGLTACFNKKVDLISPGKVEDLHQGIEKSKPTTYLLVGFAGLMDPGTHPANWLGKIKGMIIDKTATSTSKPQIHELLIKRSNENRTVQAHAEEADQQILNYLRGQGIKDLNSVGLVLVAESYGGLVAAQLALKNSFGNRGISIAGLVTVRTPWEGVSLVQAIPTLAPWAPQFKEMFSDMAGMIDSYNQCKDALETLNPSSSFITGLKNNGLSTLKFPILALAGKDAEATFPYAGLQMLPMAILFMPQLAQQVTQISSLLTLYPAGNDGLVLTSSATAANNNTGSNFESHVLNNFPHFGNTTEHVVALQLLKSFIDKMVE